MAVIKKDGNIMALPLSIKRGNPIPVDSTQVWYNFEQLQTYAQSDPVAYVGQICTVVNETASTAEAYMITSVGGNLVKLAQTTASGDITEDVIELQGQVADILEDIGAYDTAVAGDGSVYGAIKTVENSVTTLSSNLSNNYYDKSTTDSKISDAVSAAISSTYKAAGSVASVEAISVDAAHEGFVYNMSAQFVTTEAFVEGAGVTYPAGTNVVVIETQADPATYGLDVLSGFVDTSEFVSNDSLTSTLGNYVQKEAGKSLISDDLITKVTGMANIKGVASGELQVGAEDGILSILAVSQDKVTGLSDALSKKVDKVEGSSLVSDTLITKLQNQATITSVGSGLNLDAGVLTVSNVDASAIEGLSEVMTKVEGLANIKSVAAGELAISGAGELGITAVAQEKVTGLSTTLAGKLSGVTVGTTPLVAAEGVVTIPVATNAVLGVVLSSSEANKVAVAADGTMEVNSVSTDKLVQGADTLVLDGGDSGVEA